MPTESAWLDITRWDPNPKYNYSHVWSVSRSIPHAKSHTIDCYISSIGRYLTNPSRTHPTQSALIMTNLTLRPTPIAVEATDRTWIEWPSHGHGDIEALWDHMACTWSAHCIALSYDPCTSRPQLCPIPLHQPLHIAQSIPAKAQARTHPHSLEWHWPPSKIMWSSRDDRATMCHPRHLISRPSSWRTWDLRAQPSFLSIYFYLIAY